MRAPAQPVCLLLLALAASARAADKPRPAPPVKPAVEYTVHETHAAEKVTVAAEPCTAPKDCAFFRLPYLSHGFLPIRVIISNDRDQALVLDDVRIQFFPEHGERQPAASDDDLNRRLFSRRQAEPTHIPLIPIPIRHEQVDQKIVNDDADFGFASTVVPAHSTRAGYVFYDTQGIDEPVLRHAELGLKQMRSSDAAGARVEIFPFTLALDASLAAHPSGPEPQRP